MQRLRRQAHRKHRALACFARHGHVAAHHARELARERKAELGTPERRAVSESAWGPLCITANLLVDWPLRVIRVGHDREDTAGYVRFAPKSGPIADGSVGLLCANRVLTRCSKKPRYSITPSARASRVGGTSRLARERFAERK
jgi:hypothetical protein